MENIEETSCQIDFDSIKNIIIKEIQNSKYLIWVAVAWFSDLDLSKSLQEAHKRGVNVQVIISEYDSKPSYEMVEQQLITSGISVLKYPRRGNNIMHYKFAVFDLERVISGSFNWTCNANGSKETITTVQDSVIAQETASQFIALKNKCMR